MGLSYENKHLFSDDRWLTMKYAIVNGTKTEATKGVKGVCPSCGSALIAKCGDRKINHWAHKGNRICDPWWEPETEWHRSWKNNYAVEWQEISMPDERTGEKHIADVRTADNLVIEFQHSHIDPQEQTAREKFYENMVWVVDGTRLKWDYPRFLKGRSDFRGTDKPGVFLVEFTDEVFPSAWLHSSVPVIFDFKGLEILNDTNDIRNHLYCLFPQRIDRYAILAEISRNAFINTSINGKWSSSVRGLIEHFIHLKQEQQRIAKQLLQTNIRQRESPYIFERGRWKKRRRF